MFTPEVEAELSPTQQQVVLDLTCDTAEKISDRFAAARTDARSRLIELVVGGSVGLEGEVDCAEANRLMDQLEIIARQQEALAIRRPAVSNIY